MKKQFTVYLKKQKSAIVNFSYRRKLKNKDFSIISNNCWGGRVYQDLGLPYSTPFVGLFVFAPDYIRLLKDLKYYLGLPLKFTRQSKYKEVTDETYPIGLLGDVEIHFMHYKDEDEARQKWDRRVKKVNWDNLFVKFCDRDQCTKELLSEFDNLELDNKISFTAHEHPDLQNYIWFKEFENKPFVEPELTVYKRYFDVVNWLNKGKVYTK